MLANVVVMCVDHFDLRQYEDSLWYVLMSLIINRAVYVSCSQNDLHIRCITTHTHTHNIQLTQSF
jgi:hypothetical protein